MRKLVALAVICGFLSLGCGTPSTPSGKKPMDSKDKITKPETKPEPKPELKTPEAKPETKPEPKPETKPAEPKKAGDDKPKDEKKEIK